MRHLFTAAAAVALAVGAQPALAAPGVGDKVYGATVEAGVSEVEARYGRLTGDAADGEDGMVLELAHGLSDRFAAGVLIELEREPGDKRRVEAFAVEGIAHLGRIESLGLDVAAYGEYEAVRGGRDAVETKLLLQHRRGPFDGRLNLIAAKSLRDGAPVELAYAASVDWAAVGEFRLGLEAFGELGTAHHFAPRAEHFAGPMIKTEIEHLAGGELGIEAAYLVALGASRDETDGQARLVLEYEFRF